VSAIHPGILILPEPNWRVAEKALSEIATCEIAHVNAEHIIRRFVHFGERQDWLAGVHVLDCVSEMQADRTKEDLLENVSTCMEFWRKPVKCKWTGHLWTLHDIYNCTYYPLENGEYLVTAVYETETDQI